MFMHKIINVLFFLPIEIITSNTSTQNSTHENCAPWLEIYEHAGPYYETSVFYKVRAKMMNGLFFY